jgi:hypothetical protein
MATERALYTETDSEEEISTDVESDKMPPHQEPCFHSENNGDDEEEEPESGTYQT